MVSHSTCLVNSELQPDKEAATTIAVDSIVAFKILGFAILTSPSYFYLLESMSKIQVFYFTHHNALVCI